MRRIHERRAAARAAETVVQRFCRHYHARLAALGDGRGGEGDGRQRVKEEVEEVEEEGEKMEEEEGKVEGVEKKEELDDDDDDAEYESVGSPSVMVNSDDEAW